MKRIVAILLLLSFAVPAFAGDPCRDCEKQRRAAVLKERAREYRTVRREPAPQVAEKCKGHGVLGYVVVGVLAGGVGYLIGHDSRESETTVVTIHDVPKCPRHK